jgi:hypothetical protein
MDFLYNDASMLVQLVMNWLLAQGANINAQNIASGLLTLLVRAAL